MFSIAHTPFRTCWRCGCNTPECEYFFVRYCFWKLFQFTYLWFLQRRRAQKPGRSGTRAGEAEGSNSQSVVRIWREVWCGEGQDGQGWRVLFTFWSLTLCLCPAVWSSSSVQVAVGHDYVAQVEQHSSQKDMTKGFGGKFGVQKDRVDKVRKQNISLLTC